MQGIQSLCTGVCFISVVGFFLSGRPLDLPDHHVLAGQEHAVSLRDDQGAAAGESQRRIDDGAAQRDAGTPCQAAGTAETVAGPGAEATGTDPGDRRAKRPPRGAGTQAAGTDGQ